MTTLEHEDQQPLDQDGYLPWSQPATNLPERSPLLGDRAVNMPANGLDQSLVGRWVEFDYTPIVGTHELHVVGRLRAVLVPPHGETASFVTLFVDGSAEIDPDEPVTVDAEQVITVEVQP